MDAIIAIIVIISFIIKAIDKEQKKSGGKQKKRSTEQWQQMMHSVRGQLNPQTDRRTSWTAGQQTSRRSSNDAYYYAQQQRATKDRLQQKYGQQQSYAQNASKTNILSRAKDNVKESEPSTIRQELHAEVCTEYRSHADVAPDLKAHKAHSAECSFDMESDVMKRVNDLIVMGYSGDMKFERDFIAEGVEMLNNFSL